MTASSRGATGMGAYYAAGNAGFLTGPLVAGTMLSLMGGTEPGPGIYVMVLCLFAVAHLVSTSYAASTWA